MIGRKRNTAWPAMLVAGGLWLFAALPAAAAEHPGEGSEHAGEAAEGAEHPGDGHSEDKHEEKHKDKKEEKHDRKKDHEHPSGAHEHPGDNASAPDFDADQIKTAMREHIRRRSENGVFEIEDEKTGETLPLSFVKIHDPVRKIDEGSYFACTDFHVAGDEGKVYDLDFWLKPDDGQLVVHRESIHKEPARPWYGLGWTKKPRYTFVDDEVTPIQ